MEVMMSIARFQVDVPAGMKRIDGGAFLMGSEQFYPEEAPVRRVRVGSFLIDETPVTNAQFARFVSETGYVTVAEMPLSLADYPDMGAEAAMAGSSVFVMPGRDSGSDRHLSWWRFVQGAHWRCPLGPASDVAALADHPVVHIAWEDARAYASWAGKVLPSEAEWEFAARGGLDGKAFAWGDELAPQGRMLANYWQGAFPHTNLLLDGWERTSPVGSFPPNGYGLYDMIGNVWEWTEDWWALPDAVTVHGKSCCARTDAHGGDEARSCDAGDPARVPRKVIKGGSHLCAPNYCQRYRPAARHPQAIDTGTSHIGFRCIIRLDSQD
jgi:formylglycine-generating enzyme required for sulfatase activity